jgi:hypothetical protein
MKKCSEIGLTIKTLESDQKLQDIVLSIHHIYFHTLSSTPSFKIIQNHNGATFILQAQQQIVVGQMPQRPQVAGQPAPPPEQQSMDAPVPMEPVNEELEQD